MNWKKTYLESAIPMICDVWKKIKTNKKISLPPEGKNFKIKNKYKKKLKTNFKIRINEGGGINERKKYKNTVTKADSYDTKIKWRSSVYEWIFFETTRKKFQNEIYCEI